MKIEILFPEFCNLFGDISNMKYLRKCLPNEEYIETSIEDEPAFLNEDIQFIYMGAMTERTQEKVIKKLMPYKEKINELIEKGVVLLCTGNALEIFGKYIENEDVCLVNKSLYAEALNKAGFDFTAVIRNFADRNQIERNSQGKFIHQTKAFGVKANYIKFRLEPEKSDLAYESNYKQEEMEDLPF